ncbi:DUF6600 domain-containing protein [Dongia sedimenti]|uniref:FecR family protein n=1 Tax=Dongia sedimenti TaxID=3064282 RepID=A0ABU0YLZ5_9PROT|nr:hypothetical protein [Rhodospirillaceae bacterium R-7]
MIRILALLLALFVSSTAMAEESPADPPKQIGRLAAISGAVTYSAAADAPASDITVNYPLTTGNRIATPARGHAAIDIAAGRFYLDGDSAVTVGALGPGTATVSLEQGALILHVLPGGAGQVFVVQTPRGALRADQPGYFEVEIDDGSGAVVVSALEGGAQFNDTIVLPPGTRARVAKDAAPALDAAVEDDFIRRVAAEVEASGENKLEAPTHVSPQTTGFQALEHYGLWVATEQYGWAWEPQVPSDWAPYSKGRWVEIPQLGRTWIDDSPWGFAPSHYGRWTEVNDRWVWVPGNAASASLDAPAAVSFFGTQGRNSQGAVGWVALGPEQPVFGPAPVIVNNVRVINPPDVVNVTNVNNTTTNVTAVTKPDRRPAVVLIPSFPPSPQPTPSPGGGSPASNLTGLGAAGAPMQGGVRFPGR